MAAALVGGDTYGTFPSQPLRSRLHERSASDRFLLGPLVLAEFLSHVWLYQKPVQKRPRKALEGGARRDSLSLHFVATLDRTYGES